MGSEGEWRDLVRRVDIGAAFDEDVGQLSEILL